MKQMYFAGATAEELEERVKRDFLGANIHLDKELAFYHFYIPLIESGEKQCTIRFRPACIRLPWYETGGLIVLPFFATDPEDKGYKEDLGHIRLSRVLVSDVKDFPKWAAKMDGFSNKKKMIKRISEIYNHALQPDDFLSVYFIERLYLKK